MGGVSSKAVRKFPKTTKPTWAGARTGDSSPSHAEPPYGSRPTIPRASETRTEAIEQDSKDPQLAANLLKLGAVRVDHHMRTIPVMNQVDQIFRSRLQSESQARSTHTTHNHLLGSSLTELLDEYKSVTTPAELERLAKRYNIDVQKIVSLSKSIASPSVDEGSISRTVGNGGVERISMKAKWVEPSIATKLQQSTTPR